MPKEARTKIIATLGPASREPKLLAELVRTGVEDISVMGRNTQGVTLIRVGQGQRLVGLARIESIDDEDE